MMNAIAGELCQHGIRINSVLPIKQELLGSENSLHGILWPMTYLTTFLPGVIQSSRPQRLKSKKKAILDHYRDGIPPWADSAS